MVGISQSRKCYKYHFCRKLGLTVAARMHAEIDRAFELRLILEVLLSIVARRAGA